VGVDGLELLVDRLPAPRLRLRRQAGAAPAPSASWPSTPSPITWTPPRLPRTLSGLPAPDTSAVWKYNPESFRGYRLGDEQVGQWSDEARISVMG